MSFCNFSKSYAENAYTSVENKFIVKYLPQAANAAVKVYLYGLYLCQNPARDFSLENCAEVLHLPVETVKEAFVFWEDCDLVQILCEEPFTLEYLPVSASDGRPKKVNYDKYADFNKELQRKMQAAGVFLDYSTLQKYMNFLQANEMEQQAFLLVVEYCIQKSGGVVSHAQIFNKAKNFIKRGLFTYTQVEKALSDFNVHTADLKRVLNALAITHEPTEAEYALLDKWLASGLEVNAVVEAARHVKRGSMPGLDLVCEDLTAKNKLTKAEVGEYLTERDMLSNLTFRIARSLGVKVASPQVYVDEYTSKWYERGFDEASLCSLALFCVKTERNSFSQLDTLLDKLYEEGIVSEESVQNYLENAHTDLKLLNKIQKYCSYIRCSEANLETVSVWRKWNFDESMMIEAAKKASSTTHPIPYINKILSDWKRENIFTVSQIPTESKPERQAGQKVFVNAAVVAADEKSDRERYYAELKTKAQAIADKNTDRAMQNAEYKNTVSRLSDAEREAAKAEVFHPENLPALLAAVQSLKAEKIRLLSGMGMTSDDLLPHYQCKKCSDSGFLPDGRACDCYPKK
jgi:DNA replication protein DnaD